MSAGPRIDYREFNEIAAGAAAALRALGQAVDDSGIEKPLTELLKVRASQLNGCAFCVQFHLNLARQHGVDARKLDLVAAWRHAGVFTDREAAALAWTDALTLTAPEPERDAVYGLLQGLFTRNEIAHLTAAIANINAWNRIAGGLRFTPPRPRPSASTA